MTDVIAAPASTLSVDLGASSYRLELEKRFIFCAVLLVSAAFVGQLLLTARLAGSLATLAWLGAICTLALAVAHYALFKPVRQLLAIATAIRSGDYSGQLRLARRDELGSLALEMDALCDQLRAAKHAAESHLVALDRLRHSDRIATLGRLASSVAHELGNPLSVIELRAQLITLDDPRAFAHAKQNAAVIVQQTKRMAKIIDEILSFARLQPVRISRFDVVDVLRQAIVLSEHTAKKHNTHVTLEVARSEMQLDGDADKLLQVVVNLVANGIQSMPGGGAVRVTARDERRVPAEDPTGAPRDYICVGVVDRGVGIPPQLITKVFEPFHSTRTNSGGTGLGLSVAQGIAREHEGWISVESAVGAGSSFEVHVPVRRLHGDHNAT
jgi:two-component system, NtrC family, sensor kinase